MTCKINDILPLHLSDKFNSELFDGVDKIIAQFLEAPIEKHKDFRFIPRKRRIYEHFDKEFKKMYPKGIDENDPPKIHINRVGQYYIQKRILSASDIMTIAGRWFGPFDEIICIYDGKYCGEWKCTRCDYDTDIIHLTSRDGQRKHRLKIPRHKMYVGFFRGYIPIDLNISSKTSLEIIRTN